MEERVAIVKVAEQFDADPEGFRKSCESQQRELGEKISNAETILPDARISDDLLRTTAEMCIELGVRTHRDMHHLTRTIPKRSNWDRPDPRDMLHRYISVNHATVQTDRIAERLAF